MQFIQCFSLFFIFFIGFTNSKGLIPSKVLRTLSTFPYITPKSENQEKYGNILRDLKNKILIVTGPAGSGKTKIACDYAINQLLAKNTTKIILTRPVVSVEKENLGFLPGSIGQKMDPWTRPIFDIFQEYLSMKEIQTLIENGYIEISPLGFMRGRTFQNCIIIADEMQNSTPKQMLMLLTRIGKGTKMIITGDAQQSDLGEGVNGLTDFSMKLKEKLGAEGIGMIEMKEEDVVREEVVKEVLRLYATVTPQQPLESSLISHESSSNEEIIVNKRPSNNSLDDCAIIPLHLYNRVKGQ
jgi:phosphate starvation-inducible PhoH-like protein